MFRRFFVTALLIGGSLTLMVLLNTPLISISVNAETLDQVRQEPLDAQRWNEPSPSKNIWGLTLNETDESQLKEWIRTRKIACAKRTSGYSYIKCGKVPLKVLGLHRAAVPKPQN